MIETENLRLIPVERFHIEALLRGASELAALLGVRVPDGWPEFPEAFALPPGESPESSPPSEWDGYFYIHPKEGTLVGNGGYKGSPNASGEVEIGYEIAVGYRNRGFATEAARGLVGNAFAHEEVAAVIAHTLAEKNASNTVLQRAGMKFAGVVEDPEDGTLWRWRIGRADHHPGTPANLPDTIT